MNRITLSLLILVNIIGCQAEPPQPSPAEQFKVLVDAKRLELKSFLESKNSKLSGGEATIKETPNVDDIKDHTHIGTLAFSYSTMQNRADEVKAYYHFDTSMKRWRFFNAVNTPGYPYQGSEKFLVTFPEVEAVLKKTP